MELCWAICALLCCCPLALCVVVADEAQLMLELVELWYGALSNGGRKHMSTSPVLTFVPSSSWNRLFRIMSDVKEFFSKNAFCFVDETQLLCWL